MHLLTKCGLSPAHAVLTNGNISWLFRGEADKKFYVDGPFNGSSGLISIIQYACKKTKRTQQDVLVTIEEAARQDNDGLDHKHSTDDDGDAAANISMEESHGS